MHDAVLAGSWNVVHNKVGTVDRPITVLLIESYRQASVDNAASSASIELQARVDKRIHTSMSAAHM